MSQASPAISTSYFGNAKVVENKSGVMPGYAHANVSEQRDCVPFGQGMSGKYNTDSSALGKQDLWRPYLEGKKITKLPKIVRHASLEVCAACHGSGQSLGAARYHARCTRASSVHAARLILGSSARLRD